MDTMFLTSRTQNAIIARVMSVFDNVEAFLFDLDGTLLDSDDEAVAKTARRLEQLGIRHAQRRARLHHHLLRVATAGWRQAGPTQPWHR